MVILRPPGDRPEPASDRKASSAGQGRPIYQKAARAPRGRKAVYIETLTEARLTQASAELNRDPSEMAEAALREYLHREAAALFEREFAAVQHVGPISVQRWEFQKAWVPPAWTRS